MENKTTKTTENVIELFELFSNMPADEQQAALETYDEMLTRRPPNNAEFFTKLREYLLELNN
jgi:hypothetical protein